MAVSKIVKKYVEMAVREEIQWVRPGYGSNTVDRVVRATMKDIGEVSRKTLYRAIELAAEQAQGEGEGE